MDNLSAKGISWYYDRLNRHCCRLTKPRRAILDILEDTGEHLSAEQIHRQVSKISTNAGLSTVYRNLELLVRIGLVWKFDAGDKKARYEIAKRTDENHHHHLICKKCNTIIDYSASVDNEKDFIKMREKNLSRKYNFKIENHCIDFFGLCYKCRKS
ncbi:MAG: Fur family transcriptional regulator [Candidatus Omnitrophica bacterium]|nr:Fur family transcriptional regulator [Candidatus Omnitrophota bacterium]